MKLVCDVFGIVDHSKDDRESNYTYLCDELAAGSKTSDHTISFSNTSLITTLTAGFEISHFALIMPECVRTNT